MNKKNVLVIFGGVSPEHEVSKISAYSIIANLPEEKYNIIPVYISKEGKWLLYDGSIDNLRNVPWEKFGTPAVLSPDRINKGLLRIVGDKVRYVPVDAAFPALHGVYGEDGSIQGLLELAGIPYVGSGILASALAMDKAMLKLFAARLGFKLAEYLVFDQPENAEELQGILKRIRYKIGYPCFIKPVSAGSSIGVSKAQNKRELQDAVELAITCGNRIMAEKAVVGRELSVALFGYGANAEASVVGEITPKAGFYDYASKYNSPEIQIKAPADIPEETSETVRRMAIEIFSAIGGSGLAKVDFFLEESSGNILFSELNTMPGFTSQCLYPTLWRATGASFPDILDKLISNEVR
ncbi:MAG: D-alanine--D-alanine ligase [Clostridiales bacterium]|jgi:D-alanine-D-alanine ligase|nr:D-alanine--D-alanine ligase [Clostridiales bacterium]